MTQNTDYIDVIPNNVIIYRRARSPYWQMRLKLPRPKGSVKKSTGALDETEARKVAIKYFSELSYKIDNELTTEQYDFDKLYNAWWRGEKGSKSDAYRFHRGHHKALFASIFYERVTKQGCVYSKGL